MLNIILILKTILQFNGLYKKNNINKEYNITDRAKFIIKVVNLNSKITMTFT